MAATPQTDTHSTLRRDSTTLEAAVETAAQSWTMWPKFLWRQMLRSPIMRTQIAD